MKTLVITAIVLCSATAFAGPMKERRDDKRDKRVEALTDWKKLGERVVNGAADKDTIVVGLKEGKFKSVLFKCEHSALWMSDVVITFGNGETFSPNTRLVFGEGGKSAVIDLPGEARFIKSVSFKYGNLPGGGRAQLELWAKEA